MKNKCQHINKKNIDSHHNPDNSDFITVECLDCNMIRYETRYKSGKMKGKLDQVGGLVKNIILKNEIYNTSWKIITNRN